MAHFADMLARGAKAEIGYDDGVAALTLATAAQASHDARRAGSLYLPQKKAAPFGAA